MDPKSQRNEVVWLVHLAFWVHGLRKVRSPNDVFQCYGTCTICSTELDFLAIHKGNCKFEFRPAPPVGGAQNSSRI